MSDISHLVESVSRGRNLETAAQLAREKEQLLAELSQRHQLNNSDNNRSISSIFSPEKRLAALEEVHQRHVVNTPIVQIIRNEIEFELAEYPRERFYLNHLKRGFDTWHEDAKNNSAKVKENTKLSLISGAPHADVNDHGPLIQLLQSVYEVPAAAGAEILNFVFDRLKRTFGVFMVINTFDEFDLVCRWIQKEMHERSLESDGRAADTPEFNAPYAALCKSIPSHYPQAKAAIREFTFSSNATDDLSRWEKLQRRFAANGLNLDFFEMYVDCRRALRARAMQQQQQQRLQLYHHSKK